jgi:predicted dehydrogenase
VGSVIPARLRAGTVGIGRLGREHARVLASLPGVELAAVYDVHHERGQEVAARNGAHQAASLEALIDACDLVTIASPTSTHFEIAYRVIERGRACFVEKPICVSADLARRLVHEAEARGVPLGVGQIERYNPAVAALSELGVTPRFIEAHRLAGFSPRGTDVAVVFDLMIHDIDLVLHLIGEEPSHIHAAGAAVISEDLDICNARMEFPRGAVANLTASRISTFGMRKFRIFAEQAYVALDLKEKNLEYYRLYPSAATASGAGAGGMIMPFGDRGQVLAVERREGESEEMLKLELADFVRAVRLGTPPPVDGRAGARALGVAEQVHRQAHELLQRAHLA